MQTKTLSPHTPTPISNNVFTEISEKVEERGFYLYNWISPDELRLSVRADYLAIIQKASIPLAIVTALAGFIGYSGGIGGIIVAVLAVLGIFYAVVAIILIVKMFRKAYLYARAADVVVTDNHFVSGGKVLLKDDFEGQKEAFRVMETLFHEPIFGKSEIAEYVEMQKKSLIDQLKTIAKTGADMLENTRSSRESGGLAIVLILAGFLYSAMMGIVYFAGVWIVALIARGFAWIAQKVLLALHNKEHIIQSLFVDITRISIDLKKEKKDAISFLTEAQNNEWLDNLSGRIEWSFRFINEYASDATEKSVKLRKELESSKYKEIFNFVKYDSWIKVQILEPIDEILALLYTNKETITKTLAELDEKVYKKPGDNFWGASFTSTMQVQKERFEMQIASIDRMIAMLETYKTKLQ